MDKKEAREAMRKRRRRVPPDERAAASAEICEKLLARPEMRAAADRGGTVALYWATGEEIDLAPLAAALLARGVRVAAPRWDAGRKRYVLADSSGPLRAGPLGIMEPGPDAPEVREGDVAVWIVPGLAFARDGTRAGYGGGWYDRMLAEAAPSATVLGVAYGFQVVDALPAEAHDVRVCDTIVPG